MTAANTCPDTDCLIQGSGKYLIGDKVAPRTVSGYATVLGRVMGRFHDPILDCSGAPKVTDAALQPVKHTKRTTKGTQVVNDDVKVKLAAGTKKVLSEYVGGSFNVDVDKAVEVTTQSDYAYDVDVYTLDDDFERERKKLCAADLAKDPKLNGFVVSVAIVKMSATVKNTIKDNLKAALGAAAQVDVAEGADAHLEAGVGTRTKLDKVIDDALGNDSVQYMIGWGWR